MVHTSHDSRIYVPIPLRSLSQDDHRNYANIKTPISGKDGRHGGPRIVFKDLRYKVSVKGKTGMFKRGVKGEGGGGEKVLVDGVSVEIRTGEMLAIMGPSGAGKSTLLDLMSFRKEPENGGSVTLNGRVMKAKSIAQVSSFVEQDDQHYGVLTVQETISYAARLSEPHLSKAEIKSRVETIVEALGLKGCESTRIGTPIQRGVSGGQKRRVTVGTGLVTFPRILFLDEPTSGLDASSAREVVASIRRFAEKEGIFVVATIHAPSINTLNHFDKLLVLTDGRVAYNGKVDGVAEVCERVGSPVPQYVNPADHIMDLVTTDFGSRAPIYLEGLLRLAAAQKEPLKAEQVGSSGGSDAGRLLDGRGQSVWKSTLILSERTAVNYSRNLLAYGVRLGMYAGMGFLLATIWVHLGTSDGKSNDRLSVHFFSIAFLAFMSVAGIPAFLEERAVFRRERHNGLYGPLPFILSNTIITIPFLFACALLFSLICYFAIGLHPGAGHFFRFLIYLFLALYAAESQCLIIAALVPIFIAGLALGAFMNGFWMCVQGYFIKARSLPRFWYYSFHFLDYQTFAFELLANNDLRGLTFKCDSAVDAVGNCQCTYPVSQATKAMGQCIVSGQDVLDYLEIGRIPIGGYAGILIGIAVLYRVMLYCILRFIH